MHFNCKQFTNGTTSTDPKDFRAVAMKHIFQKIISFVKLKLF
jgi:hypothetical protein